VSSTRALADAQALRTALVRQLAAATTTAEIDSLQARLNTVEGTISADAAALRSLTSQIDYAQVTVTISARSNPVPPPRSSRGFTLGHAVHVAGRVLVVAAGVALIALAALVPVALVVLLLAWLAAALRRRRREQALDLA
jgi:Flp pilus assembly protein TadB